MPSAMMRVPACSTRGIWILHRWHNSAVALGCRKWYATSGGVDELIFNEKSIRYLVTAILNDVKTDDLCIGEDGTYVKILRHMNCQNCQFI